MCGPSGAPAVGLVASATGVTLTYGNGSAGLNNDCSDPMTPGVISLTIQASQTDGTGVLTICVPRPDQLASTPAPLTFVNMGAKLEDVTGSAAGCTFTLDKTQPATGTASSKGLCGNGSDHAGFALTLDGGVSLTRTCGATVDAVTVKLAGTVAITVP